MPSAPVPAPPPADPPRVSRWRRAPLWVALVALLLVAQSLLVWLTLNYESSRAQEQVDSAAAEVAGDLRRALSADLQGLQALLWAEPSLEEWRGSASALLHAERALLRIEMRDLGMQVAAAVDSPYQPPLFTRIARDDIDVETTLACSAAARASTPFFSRSYFVPMPGSLGLEVFDLCLPVQRAGQLTGFMAATLSLRRTLDDAVGPALQRSHEISFVEGDGTRLARIGLPRGAGVFEAERVVDLPGMTLQVRVDSAAGRPQLIPNLSTALVLGLSIALGVVVVLLVRDVRRRSGAESALEHALAFRKAMEDSLVTGLRARDLEGRITYVNPAFCRIVGYPAQRLIGQTVPPYWPPDQTEEYARRQSRRLAGEGAPARAGQGFETVFMRPGGERVSVLVFEAPLVESNGRHTGWMSAVLDISEQRRIEELSRQQQERLQATARLATIGEMASLLSHELNQPLAAIASYAAGSLNLVADGQADPDQRVLLRQALQRIAEQAERAGRVIKSVHDFVRRRQQAREPVAAAQLIESVLPLVRLQARKSGARVEVELSRELPRVACDRTMIEQVLLNLARNGIQAMEQHTTAEQRELRLRVYRNDVRWVTFSVTDRGPGIDAEVAQRLFTPFFTTRPEGMGLGLSLCRTVIEQHGGALDYRNLASGPAADDPAARAGVEFRFTLPAENRRGRAPSGQPARAAA